MWLYTVEQVNSCDVTKKCRLHKMKRGGEKYMGNLCNRNPFNCTALAVIASIVVGVVTAFLRITGVITLTPVFLWVTLGVALAYLAAALISAAFEKCCKKSCSALSALLGGALGTVLLSVVLLAITFAATSFLGAFLSGLLLFFFALLLTSTACYIKCLTNND